MTDNPVGDAARGQEAAYAVLVASAEDPDLRADYRTIAETFTNDDYQQIIALAWRYQFSDDRYAFKRDIRELQQFVCAKVKLDESDTQ